MKRVSFVLIMVLLSFGLSHGSDTLKFDTRLTGGVWMDGATLKINTNAAFTVEFWVATGDGVVEDSSQNYRLGWSSPFRFYGTGNVTTLIGPGVFVADPTFDAIWEMVVVNPIAPWNPNPACLNSWDGDLTNSNDSSIIGDQFNYTGVNMSPPHLPVFDTIHCFDISFPGIDVSQTPGQFCVDSGDFDVNNYDWLFEDPFPAFGPICWDVASGPLDVGDKPSDILPGEFSLSQNRPNPFNPSTLIDFALPTRSNVSINIYNVLGQKVSTLVNREYDAGYHKETWDGTIENGTPAASGIYFYKIDAEEFTDTKKMILLK